MDHHDTADPRPAAPARHVKATRDDVSDEPVPINARSFGCFMILLSVPATGLIWLVGKALLHGQIGWLWWTPLLAVLAALAVDALGQRRPRVAFAVALAVLLLGAPAVAKWQQTRDEQRFVRAVQALDPEGGEPVVRADDAVRLGWDFCFGLDKAGDAPANTFPRNDPHGFVAELGVQAGGGSTDNTRLSEDFRTVVELADRYLC